MKVDTQVVVGGLSSPLWVGPVPDGSGRIVVAEQDGTLRMVKDGQLQAEPYLDISDRIAAGGERGLLGVAFPPGFGDEHQRIYVHYSDHNGDTTIVSYDAPAGATTHRPVDRAPDPPRAAAVRQPQRRLDRVRRRPGCC